MDIKQVAQDSGMAAEVFVAERMISGLLKTLEDQKTAAYKVYEDMAQDRRNKEMQLTIAFQNLREKDRDELRRLAKPFVVAAKEAWKADGIKPGQVVLQFNAYSLSVGAGLSRVEYISLDPEKIPVFLKPWVIASKKYNEAVEKEGQLKAVAEALSVKYNGARDRLMNSAMETAIEMKTQAFQTEIGVKLACMASGLLR